VACDGREQFLSNRDRIEAFVTRMGEELDQVAVFVLAFDSDSFLIELEEGGQSRNRKVTFVEIVSDPRLKAREGDVSKAVNELYPGCGPVKLYRTADGQVGFELRVAITAGDKKRLYRRTSWRSAWSRAYARRGRRERLRADLASVRTPSRPISRAETCVPQVAQRLHPDVSAESRSC